MLPSALECCLVSMGTVPVLSGIHRQTYVRRAFSLKDNLLIDVYISPCNPQTDHLAHNNYKYCVWPWVLLSTFMHEQKHEADPES